MLGVTGWVRAPGGRGCTGVLGVGAHRPPHGAQRWPPPPAPRLGVAAPVGEKGGRARRLLRRWKKLQEQLHPASRGASEPHSGGCLGQDKFPFS